MNIKSLNNYCESIFELLSIPLIIYHSKTGKIINGYFLDASFSEMMFNDPKITNRYLGTSLFDTEHDVSFYISDDKIAFGSVKDKSSNYCVYVGPCLLADPNEQMMHSMLTRSNSPFRNDPDRYYEIIYNYIKTLPRLTINRFLWVLSFTDNCLNHEVSDPQSFYQASIAKNHVDVMDNSLADPVRDTSFSNEKYDHFMEELKALILNGSLPAVMKLWNENVTEAIYEPVRISDRDDPLRHGKNLFILFTNEISNALNHQGISRSLTSAITAELLEDVENCIILQQIETVYRKAITSFTSLVSSVRNETTGSNALIQKAVDYIHASISEPISADDIAEHIGISKGYLSVLFNREMKMKISDYVNLQKIAMAKSLLVNTDAEIIDISNYLSFSSQSYFQNVFRKLTGTTPLRYRRDSNR